MRIGTLAKKDLRLLMRDPRALIILLAMPLLFVLVLGLTLGEGFGHKADEKLRVSVLNLDEGAPRFFDRPAILGEAAALWTIHPAHGAHVAGPLGAAALVHERRQHWFPHSSWSQLVLDDLATAAGIKIEMLATRAEAEALVKRGRRAAVLVFGPHFSKRVARCSFLSSGCAEVFAVAATVPGHGRPVELALRVLCDERQDALPLYLFDGVNPFFRDGVNLDVLDAQVLRDDTQKMASAIIDQVAQVSLLRVVMPWMIGRAFEKVGDPEFMKLLGKEEQLPAEVRFFLTSDSPFFMVKKKQMGVGLQNALQNLFPRYNLTAKTWAALTKEAEHQGAGQGAYPYRPDGAGFLHRGALRYQLLVPSLLVMFAFFMVLTVGWLFVSERRQGTMKRLRAAPLTRGQVLLGKFLPCFLLSAFQGAFLFLMGKLLFDMSWGARPWLLVPVVLTTSLAAMGLSLFVAAWARTETQVAIFGTLLVLVLALLSGGLFGDRSLMPENMQTLSRVTPHAWALDAYRQLLTHPTPDAVQVWTSCAVLCGFGIAFLAAAWLKLRLED
jgi:ABC-type multidrug transport system permease subunit